VNRLGVIDYDLDGIMIRITGLERTLVDAVVRPDYSGGIEEVLKAFTAVKGEISVNKMLAILKKMDYMYPYHQALGFYLETTRSPIKCSMIAGSFMFQSAFKVFDQLHHIVKIKIKIF